jgi:hypothetical protein
VENMKGAKAIHDSTNHSPPEDGLFNVSFKVSNKQFDFTMGNISDKE